MVEVVNIIFAYITHVFEDHWLFAAITIRDNSLYCEKGGRLEHE